MYKFFLSLKLKENKSFWKIRTRILHFWELNCSILSIKNLRTSHSYADALQFICRFCRYLKLLPGSQNILILFLWATNINIFRSIVETWILHANVVRISNDVKFSGCSCRAVMMKYVCCDNYGKYVVGCKQVELEHMYEY